MSLAVYTAIMGERDVYREPPEDRYDCTAFLENPVKTKHAAVIHPPVLFEDRIRTARFFKLLPHLFFPGYSHTLWMDGSISFKEPVRIWKLMEALGDADLAVFRHRWRDCVYDEAEECKKYSLDDPDLINLQVHQYRKDGCPAHAGLAETGVVLRRMTPAVEEFDRQWWGHLQRFSRRDQISFGYLRWRTRLKIVYLEGAVTDNEFFELNHHFKASAS